MNIRHTPNFNDGPNPFEEDDRMPVGEMVRVTEDDPPAASWVERDAVVMPPEPGVGHAIAYTVQGADRQLYYVSLRAGNGFWYTTGGRAQQGVAWRELVAGMRRAGVIRYHLATGWDEVALS